MANLHKTHLANEAQRVLKAFEEASTRQVPTLPATGLVSWETLQHFVPWSQRNMRRMTKSGRFPAGVIVGGYMCWRAETVREWLDKTLPVLVAAD